MPRRRLIAWIGVSAVFVLLGYLVGSRPAAPLGYDSQFYVAMVEGHGAGVPGPFRFRVLVPLLARALPASPATALLIISYVSLFGTYLFVMRACHTIGLRVRDAAFGLLAIWGSTWHLYHYYNPYMTDAFSLLALSVMISALVREAFWPFAFAVVIGVLGRETPIFLAPAWLTTRQLARTALVVAAAAAVIWLPRVWLGDNAETTSGGAYNPASLLFTPFVFVRQLYAIWGVVWLLAMAGIWFLPRAFIAPIAWSFAALFAGALLASMVATDMGRMFGFLAPVMAIACAQLYAVISRETPALSWALVFLIALQAVFNTPVAMFDANAWFVGWPRRAFVFVELLLVIAIAFRLGGARKGS